MKKPILLAAGAVLLAAAVSAFVYVKNESNAMDELFEANVEALTRNESGTYTCESKITTGDRNTFFCGSCDWVSGSKPTWDSFTSSCTR